MTLINFCMLTIVEVTGRVGICMSWISLDLGFDVDVLVSRKDDMALWSTYNLVGI